MLSHYKYTDKEKEELIKSLTIIVDSREKVNGQILEWFDKNHVKYVVKALKNGDYSFYVPANEKLNIDRDLYFDRQIMIERKASLEEISGNITQNRARFEEELATFSGKKYLMIENANYSDIIQKNYKTDISPKAFLATLHTYNHRYGLELMFIPDAAFSGVYIYGVLSYYLQSQLR